MGARGPIAKPASERQNRVPKSLVIVPPAPAIPVAHPAPPADLLPETVARWDEFWQSDVARAVDRTAHMGALRDWIEAVDERARVMPILRENRLVEGSQGQPVLNPLASYLQQREAVIARAEAQFGMTPGAMARLGLTVGQAKLTAATLNAMLDRGARDAGNRTETEDWAADYSPA